MKQIAFTLLLMAFCARMVAGAELCIVREGADQMSIVIAPEAVEPVHTAANELQRYIERISGAKLKIVTTEVHPAIFVGESDYTRRLGLTKEKLAFQEYLLKAHDGNLILLGRDESDSDNARLVGHSFHSLKFFQETGSLYAVNDFLEKCCGVRWYMPTELGEVVPSRRTITFPDTLSIRRKPSVEFRSLFGLSNVPSSLHVWKYTAAKEPVKDVLPASELLAWGRRMKVGGLRFTTNHSNSSFRKRFPDKKSWYAHGSMQAGNQLCYSNAEVFQQVVTDARAFFDGTLPRQYVGWSLDKFFSVMPDDTNAWCVCPECRARFRQKPANAGFHNGSASGYVWSFVCDVAREVAKTHPGRFIGCCAYWDYRDCPEEIEFPNNVAVMLTKSYANFGNKAIERDAWGEIAKWRRKTPNVFLWDYYLFPNLFSCDRFPNMSPWLAAEEIDKMRKLDLHRGLMCQLDEWYWRSPAMDHLRVYVTMKLLDNWNQDADALIDEYFRLFYGPAEKPMRDYWRLLDTLYRRKNTSRTSLSKNDGPKDDWTKTCTPEDVKTLSGLLDKAERSVDAGSIYARRIRLMRNSAQAVIAENSRRQLALLKNVKKVTAERLQPGEVPDVKMTQPIWKRAQKAEKWVEAFGDAQAYFDTTAQVLYDDEFLYVGYICYDDSKYVAHAECHTRDGQVYLDDSVEFFFQEKEGAIARHFAANCDGVIYDALGRNKPQWNSQAQAQTSVEAGGWRLLLKVSWRDLGLEGPPRHQEFKVNFCRNRKNLPGFRCEFFNWSGPNGFHNPERFGTLLFP